VRPLWEHARLLRSALAPTRARAVAAAAAALAALGLFGAFAAAQTPPEAAARLDRALERMETLRGVRFELSGQVRAEGRNAPGGDIVDSVTVTGGLVPPDRLLITVDAPGGRQRLLIVGERMYVERPDGFQRMLQSAAGPLREAQALLQFIRGPGRPTFAGLGLVRGALTYRVRMDLSAGELQARLLPGREVDPGAQGLVEVEIGLLDGLVRRHTFEVSEPTDVFGHGLTQVRTSYAVEYWDFDQALDIREPD
jgi:hypothetical protein